MNMILKLAARSMITGASYMVGTMLAKYALSKETYTSFKNTEKKNKK